MPRPVQLPKVHELEARRQRIAELYFGGMTRFTQIAHTLGIHKSMVSKAWAVIVSDWKKKYVDKLHEVKLEQVARAQVLREEYREAWENSKRPTVTDSVEDVPAVRGSKTQKGVKASKKRTHSEKTTAGDPRFLDGMLKCDQEVNRILGLYADPNDRPRTDGSTSQVGADERERIRAAFLERFGLIVLGAAGEGNGQLPGQDSPGPATVDGRVWPDAGPLAGPPAPLPGPPPLGALFPPSGQDQIGSGESLGNGNDGAGAVGADPLPL